MKKLPSLYQNYLQQYFSPLEYLMLSILLMLLQKHRWIRLEKLAENFPSPIRQRSRIKKIQRFLSRPQWDVAKLWFPIFKAWLEQT
ncbi:IS4 family transposase, partial [Roseofilum sp. BLCC_M143]|nr:IS4 family transposase [Roseofilum casamattae BLCC-M143]